MPQFRGRLTHGCNRHGQQRREFEVVKSDDRNLLRHVDPFLLQKLLKTWIVATLLSVNSALGGFGARSLCTTLARTSDAWSTTTNCGFKPACINAVSYPRMR